MATPRDGIGTGRRDPRGRYYAWRRSHASESEDPVAVWCAAWREGAWDAIQRNNRLGLMLSDIIGELHKQEALYRDAEIEREVEELSPLWSSEP